VFGGVRVGLGLFRLRGGGSFLDGWGVMEINWIGMRGLRGLFMEGSMCLDGWMGRRSGLYP